MDLIKRKIINLAIPVVIDFLPVLDDALAQYRNDWIEKETVPDGNDVVCIIFSHDNVTMITIAEIDTSNQITRQFQTLKFADFVKNLINTYKNAKSGKLQD